MLANFSSNDRFELQAGRLAVDFLYHFLRQESLVSLTMGRCPLGGISFPNALNMIKPP